MFPVHSGPGFGRRERRDVAAPDVSMLGFGRRPATREHNASAEATTASPPRATPAGESDPATAPSYGQRCANPGCETRFRPRGAGASAKRYCSRRCRQRVADSRYRRSEKGRARERRYEESASGKRTRATYMAERGGVWKQFMRDFRRRARERETRLRNLY